jgi:hypothetical protein
MLKRVLIGLTAMVRLTLFQFLSQFEVRTGKIPA